MSFGNIVLLIIVAVIGYLIIIYNRFVSLRAGIDASWSDIVSYSINSSEAVGLQIHVVAKKSDNTCNAYKAHCLAKNVSGTASLVSSQNWDPYHEDNALAWDYF